MASITFEGPNPLNVQERAITEAKFSDETMMASVEAICAAYGYQPTVIIDEETVPNPVGPGTFAIEKILGFCRDHVVSYNTGKAQKVAKDTVTETLKALDAVEIEHK